MTDRTELRRLLGEHLKAMGYHDVTESWFALARAAVRALPGLLDQLDASEAQAKLDRESRSNLLRELTEAREFGTAKARELTAKLDAAEAALARVRELHRPYKVYDECDCDDDAKNDGWHVEVEDVGLTCNQLYTACDECCTEGMDYITEHCAGCHDHGPDKPRCPTIAALGGEQS